MLTYPDILICSSGSGYTSLGSMSSTWTILLFFHLFMFPMFCYKLPNLNKEHLTDPRGESLNLVEKDELWDDPEWDKAKNLEELLSTLRRPRRDVVKNESSSPTPDTDNVTVESDTTLYVTPTIIEEAHNLTSLNLVIENHTTVVYGSTPHLSPSTEENHVSTEFTTSKLSQTDQTDLVRPSTAGSAFIPNHLSTTSDTLSAEASTSATTTPAETSTLGDIFSISSHYTESKSSDKDTSEDVTFSSPTETTGDSSSTVTMTHSSNEGDGVTEHPTHSTSSFSTMYERSSTKQEQTVHSLMKQCMLIILILAIVCTLFILCTIALAAKLCSIRNQQKHKKTVNYTEMRCISTLLPENNQNNNINVKKMKTFTASGEDSDGDDNATLNSFLPDH